MADTEKSGITRRNALKAGAAVGVTAAAWQLPSIRAYAAIPPDAGVCTAPTLKFSKDTNVNCAQCEFGGDKYISYGNQGNGLSITGVITIPGTTNGISNGTLTVSVITPSADACSVGGAPYTITYVYSNPQAPKYTCVVANVNVYVQATKFVFPSPGPNLLPEINAEANAANNSNWCSSRTELDVECCPSNAFYPA